jgi:hypothetical protein
MQVNSLVLNRDPYDTSLSFRRRQILTAALLSVPKTALEVGAFDNPTLHARDAMEVRYADYFSAEELRAVASENTRRRIERIVEVNYVIKGPRLSPFIPEIIDLMVANHVIEHISNPIAWLEDIAEICSPNASIFMAVPDQRFTFDYYKQRSDITSIVRAYDEAKAQPDAYDVARMRYLHTSVDAVSLYDGAAPPEMALRTTSSYRELLERARQQVATGYIDVHCHFYTASSFVHIFTELFRSGYISWKTRLLREVERGGNEFYVLLERQPR